MKPFKELLADTKAFIVKKKELISSNIILLTKLLAIIKKFKWVTPRAVTIGYYSFKINKCFRYEMFILWMKKYFES